MNSFVCAGEKLEYTPSSDVSMDDVVIVGNQIGVALNDITANTKGILELKGVYRLPKKAALALSQGAAAFWDESLEQFDNDPTHFFAGVVHTAAASADTTVDVQLIQSINSRDYPLRDTSEAVTASGAISVETLLTTLDSSSGVHADTLADGVYVGQKKIIRMTTAGNNAVVTPANLTGGATLTFDAAGECAVLMWDGAGWSILSNTATLA